MSKIFEIGDPAIPVVLKKSARARRFSLRISNVDGGVSLTMPQRAAQRDAIAFAKGQEAWLRRHLDKQPKRKIPGFGGTILLDGLEVELHSATGRKIIHQEGRLYLPGTAEDLPAKLRGYLKALARDRMAVASERYAAMVGKKISRITMRDTRSRWGSCTSDGNLMYSWRLVMAPRSVQDYVAAHEVCHLIEMNHSAAYWAEVAAIYPDYQQQRAWLREHGAKLHQYAL